MRKSLPITPRLADQDAERRARSQDEAIREVQSHPVLDTKWLSNVKLVDTVITTIKHGLGRKPRMILTSPPRGAASAGVIQQFDSEDAASYIKLRALSFGATIFVDIEVK